MSKGISEAIDFLIDRIESIIPKRDVYHNFICVSKGHGDIDSLDNNGNQNRIFEIINKNILVPQIVLDSKTMLDRYPYLTTEI